MPTPHPSIGRLSATFERRLDERRHLTEFEVLSTHRTFAREERGAFRKLERRRELRRKGDARRAIATLT